MSDRSLFPADFTWGVATSAYQIEGSPRADGKGESIWDVFVRRPGAVVDGATGEVACDHYRRWKEDVALMADLGVDAYRFSVAWTRVLPDGAGSVNRAGLAFYEALVDELLRHGIEPVPTLYHWDLPMTLQKAGGWASRETAEAFARYAGVVAAALGDRVNRWITHNEPWVAAFAGHLEGVHAPGQRSWSAALAASHHLLLSHGLAVAVIRDSVAKQAEVGIALDCRPGRASGRSPEEVAAAAHFDGFRNRWFFDPVFGKGYPEDVAAEYGRRARFRGQLPPAVRAGDMETIAAPIDFLGLNYYTSIAVSPGSDESEDTGLSPGPDPPPGYTEMGWEITPSALTDYLERIHREYGPSEILITENGASYSDGPAANGVIEDDRRVAYLAAHIDSVAAARDRGVPVNGYFVWTLLDNLEWSLGFTQRFGLVWVDHETGRRIPKRSFAWYRDLIASRGAAGAI